MIGLTSNDSANLSINVYSQGSEVTTVPRSATITRTANYTFTLNNTYKQDAIYGASYSNYASCSTTVTQEANLIVSVYSVTLSAGSISSPPTQYAASGGDKTVSNSLAASTGSVVVKLKSGSTNNNGLSYGS